MIFSLFGTAVRADTLGPGDDAPLLKVILQDESEVDLAMVYPDQTVLFFFYPKANTPGCTAQACSLRDAYAELGKRGVVIYGVSPDKPKAQVGFIDKHELPFDLIADADLKLTEGFGLRPYTRIAFLVRNGKVIWRDDKANTRRQAEVVLEALEQSESSDAES